MSSVRIIKKYPNRRLYDTEISCYITLDDVRQLIVDGDVFVVRDVKTGADLTRAVLLQIIAEHEEAGPPMLSTTLLGHLIRFYNDPLQSAMGSYLDRSIDEFVAQQALLRRQLGTLTGQSPLTVLNPIPVVAPVIGNPGGKDKPR